MVVSEAALGRDKHGGRGPVVARGRGGRRSRTTLQDIAEEIIQHAKEIVDSEVGLPSVTRGGGRNIGYDFRSEDRRGKTYRASFGSGVKLEDGRLIIVVFNDHPHAQDVEFGNANGAVVEVGPSSTKHGYFKMPITEIAYARIRRRLALRRKPRNNKQKRIQRLLQRGRYYEKRLAGAKFDRRSTARTIAAKQAEVARKRASTNKQKAIDALRTAENIKKQRKNGPRPNTFVGRDRKTKKPALFSRTFRTYDGYGILQRAVRNITRHRF